MTSARSRNPPSSLVMKQKTSLPKNGSEVAGKTRPIFSGDQSANHRSRVDNGGGLTFLLLPTMKKYKTQRKQAEDEGVFLRFGDDLAVDNNPHRAVRRSRKSRNSSPIIESSRIEVADGFVDHARALPRRSLPVPIKQVGRLNANAPTIPMKIRSLIHKQAGNGSGASACDGDGRRIGGVGGKSDVGFAAAGNSGIHRSDVFGVGAGKEGREINGLIGREVVLVNFAGGLPTIRRRMVA